MAYIKANGTKIIFMIAVFSFLGVSIPHVAAIFRMYEPVAHGTNDIAWNVCSFAAAAGIDILAGWLTLVMMNKDARGRDKAIIWTFIIALMVFSWYCNWLFDELHSPHPINVWAITIISLPWAGSWTVDQLTPLVVSALPVFIVAYASIAHLVGVKNVTPVISLEELKQKAAEAQERADAQVAIIKANNMVNEEKATTAIGFGKTLWNKATNRSSKEVIPTEKTQPQTQEQNTDKTSAINTEDTTSITDDPQEQEQDEAPAQESRSKRTTGPLSLSVKEAALKLGVSETRVRELRNKGKLRSPSRNAKLVTIRSVEEYAKIRETQGQTGEMKAIKPQDYAEAKAS